MDKRTRRLSIGPALLAAMLLCGEGYIAVPAHGQTIATIGPSKDNTLFESVDGSLSNGAGTGFFVGRTNQASATKRRGLLAFDIAGSLPPNATITNVTLTLNCSQSTSPGATIELRRALADWGEGTSVASGGQGGGAPATTDDATWLHRFFNTVNWTTDGGDFSTTVSGSRSVAGVGPYTWNSTPQMVSDVQSWYSNPSQNFGWVLLGDESASHTAKRFDTKEHTSPANRPVLTVTYTTTVDVNTDPTEPLEFALQQNYPNPFNPSTNIQFTIPVGTQHPDKSGQVAASLRVFDLLGREVATLVNEAKEPGTHSVQWNAEGLASGIYLYRLQAGSFVETKKLVLTK